ncbi:MAG: ThiF family adenylyltransferase [Deltaproteobacteria bacterium]|nr:ThiF family adenylyltransferase [Deltaproteobacteria bacterium]
MFPGIPWFVEHPDLYRSEASELREKFPEMTEMPEPDISGRVYFYGALKFHSGRTTTSVNIVLYYPADFPYSSPAVIPVEKLPHELGQEAPLLLDRSNIRFFSARHQMASGMICLYEADGRPWHHLAVTGVEALHRARKWLRHAIRGQFPSDLDGDHAELSEHYQATGDVLVGPAMHRTNLGAPKRFLAVQLRPKQQLFAVTHVQYEHGWADDRAVFNRLMPEAFGNEQWWDSAGTTENLDILRVKPDCLVGECYPISGEPRPYRSASEFAQTLYPEKGAAAIEALQEKYAVERTCREKVVLPIQYPGRAGSWEWLFIELQIKNTAPERIKAPTGEMVPLLDLSPSSRTALATAVPTVLRQHDLQRRSLELRNGGRAQPDINNWTVSLFGAGAIGSETGVLLAKAGIGKLKIWDNQILSAGNTIRHLSGLFGVGFPKASLTELMVKQHNPHCEVASTFGDALDAITRNPNDAWGSNATISTIADDGVELRLNKLAVSSGKTVYYLRALRSGSVGQLLRAIPGSGACLECLAHYLQDETPDPKSFPMDEIPGEIVARECGRPILAASAMDLTTVAAFGSRLILGDLAQPSENNLWVWTTDGIPGHSELAKPFSMASSFLPPHPACSVCRPKAIGNVHFPKDVQARMIDLARQHEPNETGGMLIGYRKGQDVFVLEASDAGPKATSMPSRFERDGGYSETYLMDAVRRNGNGIDYVGDWHSHPGYPAVPSPRDAVSMHDIAADPGYRTDYPIMAIVGLPDSGKSGDPEFTCYCFPKGSSSYSVGVRITDSAPVSRTGD